MGGCYPTEESQTQGAPDIAVVIGRGGKASMAVHGCCSFSGVRQRVELAFGQRFSVNPPWIRRICRTPAQSAFNLGEMPVGLDCSDAGFYSLDKPHGSFKAFCLGSVDGSETISLCFSSPGHYCWGTKPASSASKKSPQIPPSPLIQNSHSVTALPRSL